MEKGRFSKYGWFVHDIVEFERAWCPICTKARVHEKYNGVLFCIGCGEQTDSKVGPAFQIEHFIKQGGTV